MRQFLWCSAAILVCYMAVTVESKSVSKRSAHQDPYEHVDLEKYRDKKKVEVVFGAKNAIIGFVFDVLKKTTQQVTTKILKKKLNKFIDQKTKWVAQLDKQNILKNKAQNIEPPADAVLSLSSILSGVIGSTLEASAPLVSVVTSKLGGASGGSSSSGHGKGFDLSALIGGHK